MGPRFLLARLLLPHYADGALPRALAKVVQSALDADSALAAAYTTLRRAESAAAGGAHTSAAQRDLIERSLFGSADHAPAARAPHAARRASRVFAPVAACASLAIFAMFSGESETQAVATHAVGNLAARGVALEHDPLGVKISCVYEGRVVDTATAGARRSSDALTCPADAMLAFSVTNLSAEERFVFVVGVAKNGDTRWYAPFDRSARSVRAEAGADNEVLPVLGDMRGMPVDDHVTLHVLLSDRAFEARDVERQIAAARRRGVPIGNIEKLPLPDIPLQARVEMLINTAGRVP